MDLEGYVRRELKKGNKKEKILQELKSLILKIKFNDDFNYEEKAEKIGEAIIEEVEKTEIKKDDEFIKILLEFPEAKVKMGEMGVGSRGIGDFFVHEKITKIASMNAKSEISSEEHDDAGIVKYDDWFIVVAIDGTHSRLSEYPFIAGFHAARAALRDILVKGAIPVALIDDLHLADDGDVGKLFDFVSGVSCVAELSGVPLVSGSTLRIGGDMVIGERMVSSVGAVGIIKEKNLIKARKNIKFGDKILMTSGAGGGTIATAAIYSGNFDVIKETLNIDFIKACYALHKEKVLEKIDAMLDITNGGIRGDAYEIIKTLNKDKNISNVEKIEKIIEILKDDYEEFFYEDANPFRVLIATILSQRTRDEKTKIAEEKLFKKISSPYDILKTPIEEIENLIKDVGFYKTKAKRIKEISKILVEKYNGNVPNDINELLKLKGVGRKTANCVLLYGYKKDAIPV
ncbi:MAG: AIR synthase related protein, partial [Candidatus Altarchaeaceae archaeon]